MKPSVNRALIGPMLDWQVWYLLSVTVFKCLMTCLASESSESGFDTSSGLLDKRLFGSVDRICIGSVIGWALSPNAGVGLIGTIGWALSPNGLGELLTVLSTTFNNSLISI